MTRITLQYNDIDSIRYVKQPYANLHITKSEIRLAKYIQKRINNKKLFCN